MLKISGNTGVQQTRRTCKTLALDESKNKDPIRFSSRYTPTRGQILAEYIRRSIFSCAIYSPLGY